MLMDFIVFSAEAVALWRLARIRYWSAFPFFYAKLALATFVYLTPHPTDERWAMGWWSTVTPALLALMVLATIEAFHRLTQRLTGKERDILQSVSIGSGFFAFVACLFLLPSNGDGWFAMYLWQQRALVTGIAAAMVPALVYDSMLSGRVPTVARLHFGLLAILNISIALAQLSFPFFHENPAWTAIEYSHLTIYCAMLITWAMVTPRAVVLSQAA
jgi:hypothetical protein